MDTCTLRGPGLAAAGHQVSVEGQYHFRRLHSSPLQCGDAAKPVHERGTPEPGRGSSSRLPALWASLKNKFSNMSSSRSSQNLTEVERAGHVGHLRGTEHPSPSAATQGIDIRRPAVSPVNVCSSPARQPLFTSRSVGATVCYAGGSPHSVAAGPGSGSTPTSLSTASDCAITAMGSPALMVPSSLPSLPVLRGGPLSVGSSVAASAYASPRVHEGYAPEVIAGCMAMASPPVPAATAGCSAPVMPAAGPAPAAQPCAPATAAAAQSKLLAVSPALPSAMSRPVWSLEDYSISRRLYKGSSSAVYKVCGRVCVRVCGRTGKTPAWKNVERGQPAPRRMLCTFCCCPVTCSWFYLLLFQATCLHSGIAVALKVYFLNRLPVNVVHMWVRKHKTPLSAHLLPAKQKPCSSTLTIDIHSFTIYGYLCAEPVWSFRLPASSPCGRPLPATLLQAQA